MITISPTTACSEIISGKFSRKQWSQHDRGSKHRPLAFLNHETLPKIFLFFVTEHVSDHLAVLRPECAEGWRDPLRMKNPEENISTYHVDNFFLKDWH